MREVRGKEIRVLDHDICPADSIETYLNDPIVPLALIARQGGVMKCWYHLEEPNPKLSRMGLNFLSAPGKHGIKT